MKMLAFTLLAYSTFCFSADDQKTKFSPENETTPQKEAVLQIIKETSPQNAKPANLKPRDSNLASLSAFDAWAGFATVPAGGSINLPTSVVDWTGASSIAIAIECPASTSLKNLAIAVSWGIPSLSLAQFMTTTDAIFGSNFVLPNMGGGVTPVYGNQLQLLLVNTGNTPISCNQV